jgi:DNA primase
MSAISEIKERYTCLDYLGDRVVRKTAAGYLARAPWRDDVHPSLTVTLNGKGWKDHVTGEHGSVIDLVMRCLGTNDVRRVLDEFGIMNLSPFDQQKILGGSKEKGNGFAFIDIMPLQSRGLFAYLYSRCVNMEIAKQFLKEAHYGFEVREDGRYLYALAYQNDKGGCELRSGSYKGSTHPKGITTHLGRENAPTVVFEGFFDMLSFATLCGGVKHNYVVLNSIVNKEAALEVLKTLRNQIYLCLDNDEGGDAATAFLLDALPGAQDIRQRFAPCKDVNEYLVKLKHEGYGSKG